MGRDSDRVVRIPYDLDPVKSTTVTGEVHVRDGVDDRLSRVFVFFDGTVPSLLVGDVVATVGAPSPSPP